MQRRLKFITLQGAMEKSPILLSQYWKNESLNGNIIISYFGGRNNIFADCIFWHSTFKAIINKIKVYNLYHKLLLNCYLHTQ